MALMMMMMMMLAVIQETERFEAYLPLRNVYVCQFTHCSQLSRVKILFLPSQKHGSAIVGCQTYSVVGRVDCHDQQN